MSIFLITQQKSPILAVFFLSFESNHCHIEGDSPLHGEIQLSLLLPSLFRCIIYLDVFLLSWRIRARSSMR